MTEKFRYYNAVCLIILLLSVPHVLYPDTAGKRQKSQQGINIVGDQEMPKMLYIIPWKDANLPDVSIVEKKYKDEIYYNPCQFILSGSDNKLSSKSDWNCMLESLSEEK